MKVLVDGTFNSTLGTVLYEMKAIDGEFARVDEGQGSHYVLGDCEDLFGPLPGLHRAPKWACNKVPDDKTKVTLDDLIY